ncbi:MAG: UvrD-helicase domain-containing protein [Oscillospiraceae bacterium]
MKTALLERHKNETVFRLLEEASMNGGKNWATDQQNAIRRAAARASRRGGSGKTAVLVERVISRLLDENDPITADQLLIVTFSNAAAGEMRERISARIAALVAADPFNLRLKRQQLGLSRANISTIHSFCLDLIRTHFQKLGVSPDFRVADENELSVMRADAMEEVVEQFYKKDADGGFAALVELLASGRDDQKLMHTVLKLYDFVRSHPFPDDWLAEKYAMYDETAEVGATVWGRTILDEAAQTLDWAAGITRGAAAGFGDDEALAKAWGPAYAKASRRLTRCAFSRARGAGMRCTTRCTPFLRPGSARCAAMPTAKKKSG